MLGAREVAGRRTYHLSDGWRKRTSVVVLAQAVVKSLFREIRRPAAAVSVEVEVRVGAGRTRRRRDVGDTGMRAERDGRGEGGSMGLEIPSFGAVIVFHERNLPSYANLARGLLRALQVFMYSDYTQKSAATIMM